MCISIIDRQGVVSSRSEQQMLIIARVVVIVVFLRPSRHDRAAMVLRTSSASDWGQNRSSITYRREFASTFFVVTRKISSRCLWRALTTLSNLSFIPIGTDMNFQTWRMTPVEHRPKMRRSFVIRSRVRIPTPTAIVAALVAAPCRRRCSTTSGLQLRADPESDEQRRRIHSRTYIVRLSESTAPRSYSRMGGPSGSGTVASPAQFRDRRAHLFVAGRGSLHRAPLSSRSNGPRSSDTRQYFYIGHRYERRSLTCRNAQLPT